MLDFATRIEQAYQKLDQRLQKREPHGSKNKDIPFTGGLISPCDLVAYQIGWGKLLLSWYQAGVSGSEIEIPLKGFGWDYEALANHFYRQHARKSLPTLRRELRTTVDEILVVVTDAQRAGQLEATGIWDWCTLKSGKAWPLKKWIQVNTVAPYQRAARLLKP